MNKVWQKICVCQQLLKSSLCGTTVLRLRRSEPATPRSKNFRFTKNQSFWSSVVSAQEIIFAYLLISYSGTAPDEAPDTALVLVTEVLVSAQINL